MEYVTTSFESYEAPLTGETIQFNPSSSAFCILKTPTKKEFEELLGEFVDQKIRVSWKELLEPVNRGISKLEHDRIRLFAATKATSKGKAKYSSSYINAEYYCKAVGEDTAYNCHVKLNEIPLEKQLELAEKIRPHTREQAEALIKTNGFHHNDPLAINYIKEVITPCESFAEAINAMVKLLLEVVADSGDKTKRSSRQHLNKTPRNTLELLSFLHAKGYILFPFIKKHSDDPFEKWMLHKNNAKHLQYPEFVNTEAYQFIETIHEASEATRANKKLASSARSLVLASTFTKAQQCSDALLNRLVDIYEDHYNNSSASESSTKKHGSSYNAFTNMVRDIFNSKHDISHLKLKHKNYTRVQRKTAHDYADFSIYAEKKPELEVWTELFSTYCLSINDTQVQARAASCRYFLDWIAGLENIPRLPTDIIRSVHINDYSEGNTLRNYIKSKYSTKACNRHLTMYRKFFDFCHDELFKKPEHRDALQSYTNPIDTKWDRFAETSTVGTKRTPIESRIMQEIRQLIVKDDYKFPKENFDFSHVHLTNHETGEYEHNVFCPSVANLLYFMLWIPTRKIQAQLLDSGEGDDFIYDFDKNDLVENKNKVGSEKNRQEGLLQKIPSGVLGITDLLGLHITTNKSSEEGYDVPWVCDELLKSLKNQYQWLKKYSPYPEKRGKESLGKTLNEDGVKTDKKFYCLFRDPSQQRADDQSKPVAAHIISKAWGLLCAEAEKRINAKLPETHKPVSLTLKDNPKKSRYDIHTLRVSGITDLLEKGVPLGVVQKFVAGHKTYVMTLHYDSPSHEKVREYLESARSKDSNVGDFKFLESELDDLEQHFVINGNYSNLDYTAFDTLKTNAGIASVRLSGICPGASCEEGGIDPYGTRSVSVPFGDRGPSCPQCRFWITGPMFLLGQVIEGNQLIRKIKKKVEAIDTIRDSIIDAEDAEDTQLYNKLSGREEREVRILSNMLTEWSERMRFYEASVNKLEAWSSYKNNKDSANSEAPVSMITKSTEEEVRYSFTESTNLELTHFISTVSEFLPEFVDSDDTSVPDLEQAIARFMAMNDLGDIMFKLSDEQRLHATNLMTEVLINNVGAESAEGLLSGESSLSEFPELKNKVKSFLTKSEDKIFKLNSNDENLIEIKNI